MLWTIEEPLLSDVEIIFQCHSYKMHLNISQHLSDIPKDSASILVQICPKHACHMLQLSK